VFFKGENERIIFKKYYALKGRRREVTRTTTLSEINTVRFRDDVELKKFCKMKIEK
jgi:hypothetical protein